MPLIFPPETITATQSAPTGQGEGYDVSGYTAVAVSVSGLADLDSYDLHHYGTIDDNDLVTGQTTFPDATEWPELADVFKTRAGSALILVPLTGVNRYAPRVTAWSASGGAPELTLRVRALTAPEAAIIRQLGVWQTFGDTEITRLSELAGDNTPVDLNPLTVINPEAADNIDLDIKVADLSGAPFEAVVRGWIELYDLNMERYTTAANLFTCQVIAKGSPLTLQPNPGLLFISDGSGELTIRVHDVVGASGAFVIVMLRPTVQLGEILFTVIAFD